LYVFALETTYREVRRFEPYRAHLIHPVYLRVFCFKRFTSEPPAGVLREGSEVTRPLPWSDLCSRVSRPPFRLLVHYKVSFFLVHSHVPSGRLRTGSEVTSHES
jgi:hypothetical protein